jgi:hypothetical protein
MIGIMIRDWRSRWLGIDFSGDHRKWGAGCAGSNIWIADIRRDDGLTLFDLKVVQSLSGDEPPFWRLRNLLAGRQFNAAGIDAPFSVPALYVPLGKHRNLLKMISEIPQTNGRCFPQACDFVHKIISGRALSTKKPLRETERHWQKLGVNVRSTLWAGARGGAAMTSACLTLLAETQCPLWPWKPAGRGLLVEAFPAAQLRHWKLPHQKYNGKAEGARSNREQIAGFLSNLIQMDLTMRQTMDDSADALDAVLCAFAAFAVTTGQTLISPALLPLAEGRIAVHDSLGAEYTVS